MAGVTISGAVSGLDTASIINSLVAVQGNQQTLLRSRQSTVQKSSDAVTALMTSLSDLATKAKKVADTNAWSGLSATSSSTSVAVTASGTTPGSLGFDVTALAKRHSLVSAEAVGSTSAVVASGPLTLTASDGTQTTIEVGGGSLTEVVSAINDADAGITAVAVQTAPGQFRLQVTAGKTGAASTFTLDGLDGFTAMNTLATGSDATIRIGGAGGYDVTSASNTFSEVVPGLSFTVSKEETGVTVSSALDGTAVAADIKTLVDAANSVLADVESQSTWDQEKKTGGALFGQSAVRSLTQSILSTVSGAGAAGISLTRDGRLSFDESKFKTAFAADPQAVAASYGASVSFEPTAGVTGRIGLLRAGDTAVPGTYDVTVTAAATREQWSVATGGTLEGKELRLTRGDTTFTYTAPTGEALADSVLAVNQRLAAAGFGVGVSLSGGDLLLTADEYGIGAAFTTELDAALGTLVAGGSDVIGTINGADSTGTGTALTVNDTTNAAYGLTLSIGLSDADVAAAGGGSVGTVTYSQGLGQKLAALVKTVTGDGGALDATKDGLSETVKDLQEQIDSWDRRLESFRTMLTRQFTAMETAIASLKSQTSFLSSLDSSMLSSGSSSSG